MRPTRTSSLVDTEESNWTFDPVRQFFFHRFSRTSPT
jgi:hypothetical protein